MEALTLKDDPTRHLVERARAGDRAATEELVRNSRSQLLDSIRRRVGSGLRGKLDPEDVVQETSVRAPRSLEGFEWQGRGSFLRWLQDIAENFILDAARRQRVRKELQLDQDFPASGASPSKNAQRGERAERLERSLEGLSPDHRKVIVLSRFERLKIKEIARRMGRSESAVKNLLLRAMKALKDSFGDTESLGLPRSDLDEGGHGE
jgi:RNA polymerase sigma-70 factor (ECF subfamily)